VLAGINPSAACAITPGWSPDGTKIVFAMFIGSQGSVNIYAANAEGTDVYQVTHESSLDFHDASPDWGPHPLARNWG